MTAGQAGSESPPAGRSRLQSLAPIVIFDAVGPVAAYYALESAGFSALLALLLSGVLPAVGIALGVVRHRHVDAFGILILVGILVATVVGLASASAHLVLLEGTVPPAVFGAVCLGSLWSKRPLIFRFALEAIGAGSAKGRDFADRWRYPGFRHAFRVITAVWGLAILAEAAAQLAIVETASTDTAKATSNLMPLVVVAAVVGWNVAYGRRSQRQGERAAAAAHARGDTPPAMPT